ncbi:MAG: AAA family ATPase, partial [Muribaculaceae bacterium]|nr:AAA family ATPase [Muribaculaceae bacterium]
IAVCLEFINERACFEPPRGVRHDLSLCLVDTTERTELTAIKRRIVIHKSELFHTATIDLPISDVPFRANHGYKLTIYDETARQTLGEYVFRLYGEREKLHESEWYQVIDCGVRPDWERAVYKNVKAIEDKEYYVRYNLTHGFGSDVPLLLPEVELRLYYPDGRRIEHRFAAPLMMHDEQLFVEQEFMVNAECGGVFYSELLCMDFPVAGFVFSTNGPDQPGYLFGHYVEPLEEYSPEAAMERLRELMPIAASEFDDAPADDNSSDSEFVDETPEQEISLDRLTGLQSVKSKLKAYERVVNFNKLRAESGLPVAAAPLHAMFLGAPGTGKTTVATLMGQMLHRAGVLSKGHVVVRERSTLLGKFYSSEAEKTLEAINEAQGGILLIDEAYQLHQPDDSRDPGKFVIETLLTALSDPERRDWMLILAGYPEQMRQMFDMNPGLKSRIPDSNVYVFEDFTEGELMEIAENYLTDNRYELTAGARAALQSRLRHDYSHRDHNFGNARHVINLIQTEILTAMAVRVMAQGELSAKALTEITAADIPAPQTTANAPRARIGYAA